MAPSQNSARNLIRSGGGPEMPPGILFGDAVDEPVLPHHTSRRDY